MNWEVQIDHVDRLQLTVLGRRMVQHLPTQLTVGIIGTLGAGKTTLTQCLAQAANIDPDAVTSPTFTLLQSHHGAIKMHHMDAYRVHDEDEFLELGVEELFEEDAWTIIEWADRVESVMPIDTLWIKIDLTDQKDRRRLTFRSHCVDLRPKIQAMIDAANGS
jgi:tRNA threonylcarbamoyladenosine biosynthesis protein TsaE